MKKSLLVIILLCIASAISAQSIERWVITSCSGTAVCGSNIYTEFSVGEPVVSSFFTPGIVLTQGFEQPATITIITEASQDGHDLSMIVFPNPASDLLNLHIDNAKSGPCTITLQDVGGRIVRNIELQPQPGNLIELSIDVHNLAGGPYLLSVIDDRSVIRTFKTIIRH